MGLNACSNFEPLADGEFLADLSCLVVSLKTKKVAGMTKRNKAVKQLLAVVCFDKDL